jgi:hypothetical protein
MNMLLPNRPTFFGEIIYLLFIYGLCLDLYITDFFVCLFSTVGEDSEHVDAASKFLSQQSSSLCLLIQVNPLAVGGGILSMVAVASLCLHPQTTNLITT